MTAERLDDERFTELAMRSLLGELESSEAAELEEEMARRGARGRAEIAEMREVLGTIALAVPSSDPPARLKRRVLDAIGAEPGASEVSGPALAAVQPIRRRPLWPLAALGGLAAALALWLAFANAGLEQENDRLRAELAAAQQQLAAADSAGVRLAELAGDLEVVAGPASAIHTLTGTGAMPAMGAARVFLDPATGRAILFAYDLPILPPGEVYELWAISEGAPRPAGVFRPDQDGDARLEITDASLLRDVDVLAVTVEPAPGTEQPTSEPVLLSS